VGEAIAKV
jgi:hypothetical protein